MPPATGWTVVIVLGAIWVGLGYLWGLKAKDSEGFMLAGRNVGLALGAATAMATWVTSNTTMVAPVLALEKGVWGMLAYASVSFSLLFFAPLAGRIQRILPHGFTSGDFFRLRYGRAGWTIFLLITFFYSVIWLVTMATAGGKLLNALGNIPYAEGMTLIMVVCVLYTLFGGLYAVIGTDFIQSLIILLGIVAIGAIVALNTDFSATYQHIETNQPALITVMFPAALLAIFNNTLFGFGEVFHNNVWWSRAYAMRKGIAPKAFFLSGLLWFPIPIAAGFLALMANPLGINVTDSGQVGPQVASHVLQSAGFGALAGILILIVLFCSMASSIDSLLAATSDLLVKDVYCNLFGGELNDRTFRRVAAVAILVVGLLAWAISLPNRPLDRVLFSSGGLVASLIWPVIAGLYWTRCNRILVVAGMVVGSVAGMLGFFFIETYTGALIGAFVSMVFTILARYVKPTEFSAAPS